MIYYKFLKLSVYYAEHFPEYDAYRKQNGQDILSDEETLKN